MKIDCVEGESLPVGDYVGKFLGVEPQDEESWAKAQYKGKDGTVLPRGIVWRWEVVIGPHAGRVADRLTPAAATKGNNTTIFAEVITGERFGVGKQFDPDRFVGTLWRFRIDPKDTGHGTYVSTRGLSRAHDLEKGPPGRSSDAVPSREPGGSHVYVIFGGRTHPEPLTPTALRTALKAGVIRTSDKAAFGGEPGWRTVGDVMIDLVEPPAVELPAAT